MKKIVCHDINKRQYEVDEDSLTFRPTVYGVLIEEGKILLSKQFGGYDFPGGGIGRGETVHQALEREFFEETGLKVKALDPVHSETTFFHPAHSDKHKNEYWNCPLTYLTVRKLGGELSTENFDKEEQEYAQMAEWINLSDIESVRFINSVDSVKIIRKAMNISISR